MDMTIRKMQNNDIKAVQKVANISWHDTYEGIIPLEIQNRFLKFAYNEEMLMRRMTSSHMLVAEVEGEVVGFANFSPLDEDNKSMLNAIYIYPHFQGGGIGTALLEAGIAKLENVKSLHLNVEKDNQAGIQFYKAKNFEIVAELKEQFDGFPLQTIQMALHFKK